MKNSYLFILVSLVLLVSCSNPKAKDYSYPLEKYYELGIPDISNPWKVSEFVDVTTALRKISNNDFLALPKKGSPKSGELFDHQISLANMSFLNIDTLPLYEKAYRIQSFLQVQSEYIDIYTDLYHREQYYKEELIEYYIFGFRITQKMLQLAYQINESEEPGDKMMQSGFEGVQYLHVIMLSDALDKQKNTSLYNAEDLETLSDSIVQSVRRNMSWFDSLAIEKIKQSMLVALDSSSSDKIRNEYRDIMKDF